ncbi:MAG: flagellar biosynthesis anti-sigma factor FlgM [Myxococcota bacterium]
MKIQSTTPTTPIAPVATEPRPSATHERKADPGAQVSLSGDAKFVSAVADEIRRGPEIRPEVVARAKAAIADGTLESDIDLDATVDRFLADL